MIRQKTLGYVYVPLRPTTKDSGAGVLALGEQLTNTNDEADFGEPENHTVT